MIWFASAINIHLELPFSQVRGCLLVLLLLLLELFTIHSSIISSLRIHLRTYIIRRLFSVASADRISYFNVVTRLTVINNYLINKIYPLVLYECNGVLFLLIVWEEEYGYCSYSQKVGKLFSIK